MKEITTAEEAKKIACDYLNNSLIKVFSKIRISASDGNFFVSVELSDLEDKERQILSRLGYKISLVLDGESYRYRIQW